MPEQRASMRDSVAIVTGASQGLGFAIARALVTAGASVVVNARNADELAKAALSLRENLASGQRVEVIAGDVSAEGTASHIAEAALSISGRVDVLVNNAGIYGPMGDSDAVDWDEWIRAIEINVYGSVLMCRAVVPCMKQARRGKIIQLSGGGATNPMPRISAYAVSKAAIVRFAETLALELSAFGIDVNAIAPGALNTRMLDEVLAAGPERVGADFHARSLKQQASGGAGFDAVIALVLFLASQESNGITGKLISALWDNWREWSSHTAELRGTDAYTLRRITGRDRGLPWGDT